MASLSAVTAFVALLALSSLSPAAACAIIGQLYCNKCGSGAYNASAGDTYITGATVSITCTFSASSYYPSVPTATYSGTGSTDSSGVFNAVLSGGTYPSHPQGIDGSFMQYVFGGNFNNGLKATIKGCQITQISGGSQSGCSVLTYNSGSCSGGGTTAGNGNSATAMTMTNYNGNNAFADIFLGSVSQTNPKASPSVCMTYPTKPATCPAPPPGVKGDPHFSGADGSHFDFSGHPNTTYCLLSDAHVHVNAFYGGRYGEYEGNSNKALTWIRQVGIMYNHHTIYLAAREGARWQYDNGYLAAIEVDGESVKLSQPGDVAFFGNNQISVSWVAGKEESGDDLVDIYQIDVEDILSMRITLRPEVDILRTETDGVVHMNLEWPVADVSEAVHGVLGQTYRKDFQGRLSAQELKFSDLLQVHVVEGDNAEGFLDGNVDDYESTSILKSDCRVSRFARASGRDSETARAKELAMGASISTMKLSRKSLNVI